MNSDFGISLCSMMLFSVPRATSEWFGTGTVILRPGNCRRRMIWLPFCRTKTKPFRCRMAQTSLAESTRSLGMSQI